VASAGNDEALLDAAFRLAMEHDPPGVMGGATRALGVAAGLAVPSAEAAALDAALLVESLASGDPDQLPERRLEALAALTRWSPAVLTQAMGLLPTGVVASRDPERTLAVARGILLRAREVLEGMAGS
jgi:hypothetical protein